MSIIEKIIFNLEVLYLKARIECNKPVQEHLSNILIFFENNKNKQIYLVDIPAGKKTKKLIKEIASKNEDDNQVTKFLTVLCKFYHALVKHKTTFEKSKHLRVSFNIRFMQKLNEIFNQDDSFKELIYKNVYTKLQEDSVKSFIKSNPSLEDLTEKMKELIDPNLDWDMETEDYYVQFPILTTIINVITKNEDNLQLTKWMNIAKEYYYVENNENNYKNDVIGIGQQLAVIDVC